MTQSQQFRSAVRIIRVGIITFVATLLGTTLGLLVSQAAVAAPNYKPAKLIISDRPGEYVSDLHWESFDVPIQVHKEGNARRAFVQLNGTLDNADETLIYDGQQIPLTPATEGEGSTFTIFVPLQGKVSILDFFTVDPYGRTQKEKVAVVFADWESFKLPVARDINVRRFLSSVGLGISDLHYQEPDVIDMNELGVTGKINVAYRLVPNTWELGGNAFFTLLPLPISIPNGEPAARWYGINGRVAYRLPIDKVKSTQFWVMTGWYVWGMIVSASPSNSYGVAYLGGPQIFLNARVTPPGKHAYWGYLKYASISNGLQIFSLTNREYALGGGWEISKPGTKHPWSLTLDIADAEYSGSAGAMHLFSISTGVSVGL